ncbi:MAG: putative colanic acid biosynthesis acetyltransferase [Bacteroidaceae bacterium]|nr:putative colanic acid biosynthesis acetyltransferase [Bacteroidaceae bacterium]
MTHSTLSLSHYRNALSRRHQLTRLVWTLVWNALARPLPRSAASGWKRWLLRRFGATIHDTAVVYSSARVYYPKHLTMGRYACLASDVDCYNVAPIVLKDNVTVSQGAFLCTASHDITDPAHRLITAPIVLEEAVWVGARAYVGMGVTIGEGAVVGATASVYKDVEPWTVVGGNPAKKLKDRILVGG